MADEQNKSESHKPSGEHKHEEHQAKPEAKGTPHPTSKTTGTAERSEKPTGAEKKTQAAEKREAGKQPSKTAPKGEKPKTGQAEDVKIVDKPTEKKHVARAKADITPEQRKALQLRATIAGRRPWFRRQQWYEYKKLADSGWRKPRGVDSAMRRHFGYEQSVVRVGFGGPKSVRGLHASGFEEVYVAQLEDLKKIKVKKQAARVSGNLGTRKLRDLYVEADKLGVRILNRRELAPAPKAAAKPATTATKTETTTKGGKTQ